MPEPLNYSDSIPFDKIRQHAKNELKLAGFYDSDNPEFEVTASFAVNVLDIVTKIHGAAIDGVSLFEVLEVVVALATFKNITPLTNHPDEWLDISDYMGGNHCWQNKRNPSVFSKDNGKTCFSIDQLKRRSLVTGVELPGQHVEWTEDDFKSVGLDQFFNGETVVPALPVKDVLSTQEGEDEH